MRKATKVWLVVATLLVIAGACAFAAIMVQCNWDFTKLSTVTYETNTYSVTEEFESISVDIDTADILFAFCEDGKCRVECYEEENAKHSVTVQEGVLVIQEAEQKAWHDHIGIYFGSPKVTVYLPKSEYASLTVKTDTGDITVENMILDVLELSVSTGDITVSAVTCQGDMQVNVTTGEMKLTDTTCQNLTSKGSTGDITLKTVIVADALAIERSTGDVRLEGADAARLSIDTNTGDVKGRLLTDKVFIAESDTGRVDVPKSENGGRCEVRTNTGDIILAVGK